MANQAFQAILNEVDRFSATADDLPALQQFTVGSIAERLPYFNWVEFYMLDPAGANFLAML